MSRTSARTSASRKTYKRNPYSQLSMYRNPKTRVTRSHIKKARSFVNDYLDRVRVFLHRVNEDDDKMNYKIILGELNNIGRIYFGDKYIESFGGEDVDIEALTKKEFLVKYEEETGMEYDDVGEDEASFSDAFRHAALIDVDTLTVPPQLWAPLVAELKKTDYIFTWKMINQLPAILGGSRLIAVHIDTEGEPQIFLPIPG